MILLVESESLYLAIEAYIKNFDSVMMTLLWICISCGLSSFLQRPIKHAEAMHDSFKISSQSVSS